MNADKNAGMKEGHTLRIERHEIKHRVRDYLVETHLDNDPRGLSDDTPLVSGGLLDSFTVVELMEFLEGEFTVELRLDRVAMSSFESIESIADLILDADGFESDRPLVVASELDGTAEAKAEA